MSRRPGELLKSTARSFPRSQLPLSSDRITSSTSTTIPITPYQLPSVSDSLFALRPSHSPKLGYPQDHRLEKPRLWQYERPSEHVSRANALPVTPIDRSIYTRPARPVQENKLSSITRFSPDESPLHPHYDYTHSPSHVVKHERDQHSYYPEYINTNQIRVHPYPPQASSSSLPIRDNARLPSCRDGHTRPRLTPPSSSVVLPPIQTIYPSLSSSSTREEKRNVVSKETSQTKKRKARICTTEGCQKYVVDHGLCIKHGGGKRCYIDSCNCRAQNRGLCWKHGGFTICKAENCTKRAKSRGICWTHGGGTRCKREACTKIAVSLGLCWAHGGGKRCEMEGCRKPASERTGNMCSDHFHSTITDQR